MGHAILVDPQLVLVGSEPRRVAVDDFPVHEQCRRRSLVPYLDVQLVFASRDGKRLGHTKLQLAVECQIELTFGDNGDGLFLTEGEGLAEFHGNVVRVLFPERRKHGSALRATVIEDVAQPYLEVARIPYPCRK